MLNKLTEDTKATALLCCYLGKNDEFKPLTPKEYSTLAQAIRLLGKRPNDLFDVNFVQEVCAEINFDDKRVNYLLSRGVQFGISLDEWNQLGIWLISRSDNCYPKRLKSHLKEQCPPILYGIGNKDLLVGGGVAIVGSRNVDEVGENFTRENASLIALQHMTVISGGAKGVDQTAMHAAIDVGGTVVGVLAENLLARSLEKYNRDAINNNRLLLLSPYHPKSKFTVGNAMARNKLIYAMADYGLVVSSDYEKGGTWTGAKEELGRSCAIPVFVRMSEIIPKGNKKLLELGAKIWPKLVNTDNLDSQLKSLANENLSINFLFEEKVSVNNIIPEKKNEFKKDYNNDSALNTQNNLVKVDYPQLVFEAVIPFILDVTKEPKTVDELVKELGLKKNQINDWLNLACDKHLVIKLNKPVRYQANNLDIKKCIGVQQNLWE